MDGKITNDLTTKENTLTTSITIFANSWKVEELDHAHCLATPTERRGCVESADDLQAATSHCQHILSDERFKKCSLVMNVTELQESCVKDFCECEDKDRKKCACQSVEIMVRECREKKVDALKEWRDEEMCRK